MENQAKPEVATPEYVQPVKRLIETIDEALKLSEQLVQEVNNNVGSSIVRAAMNHASLSTEFTQQNLHQLTRNCCPPSAAIISELEPNMEIKVPKEPKISKEIIFPKKSRSAQKRSLEKELLSEPKTKTPTETEPGIELHTQFEYGDGKTFEPEREETRAFLTFLYAHPEVWYTRKQIFNYLVNHDVLPENYKQSVLHEKLLRPSPNSTGIIYQELSDTDFLEGEIEIARMPTANNKPSIAYYYRFMPKNPARPEDD